ncbi:MAG: hypothetical protein UZ03_NOB001000538 [Nitrospira sp. OLB3]|nr:MAG: hypothetical protein UZ03_NOB001000538 [Nitrospira sp. OLB3]
MKFILLVHHDETVFETFSDERKGELLKESIQLCRDLNETGRYLHASPVQPAATAAVVRVREGKPLVTDGPSSKRGSKWRGTFSSKREIVRRLSLLRRRCPAPGSARWRSGPSERCPVCPSRACRFARARSTSGGTSAWRPIERSHRAVNQRRLLCVARIV